MLPTKGYNGNINLKKARRQIQWTAEMIQEFIRCKDDPIYFAEKYIQIVHVDRGLIPIVLYDYQKEIMEKVTNNRRVTVVTSRQAGKCVSINTIVTMKYDDQIIFITVGELYEQFKETTQYSQEISGGVGLCGMSDLLVSRETSSKTYCLGAQDTIIRIPRSNTYKLLVSGSIKSWGRDAKETSKSILWTRGAIIALQQEEQELRLRETCNNSTEGWRKQSKKNRILDEDWVEFRRSNDCFTESSSNIFFTEINREAWGRASKNNLECTSEEMAEYSKFEDKRRKSRDKQEKENTNKLQNTSGWDSRDNRSSNIIFNSLEGHWEIKNWNYIQNSPTETSSKKEVLRSYSYLEWDECRKSIRDRAENSMGESRECGSRRELRNISSRNERRIIERTSRKFDEIYLGRTERNEKNNVKEKDLYSKTNRKFTEIIDLFGWKILTSTGWEDATQLNVTVPYDTVRVILENNTTINCADNHIFISDEEQIYAKDSIGKFLKTQNGLQKVVEVIDLKRKEVMFDLSVDSEDHTYYTNGILSHNTTTAAAIILHYILFNDHKTVALLANKGDAAREILDRIKLSFESLPDWLQSGVVEWNKGSIELENGCKVLAAATSSSAIRGKSISLLYIDEAAFVENWDEFFASVFPTISSGENTKLLMTSTPNGLNFFYKTCMGAKNGTNGYQYVEVPWQRVPGRGEKWHKETLESLDFDLEKFAQEFSCQFIGSSGTLISGAVLKTLVSQNALTSHDGLNKYYDPVKDHSYVIVVDVSRGKGLDYSAFQVVDVTTMPYQQVCTYKNNMITPLDYSGTIYMTSKAYNSATILVEINDVGAQVADSLYYDYECETIVYTENAGARGKRISTGFGKGSGIDRGIRTTKTVKAIGCSMLKLLVEQRQLIINDHDTIHELSRFSKKGVSYEAEAGCNDDLVMGLVLFAWMTDQQYFKELTDINTLMKLRDKTEEELENDLVPFGFMDDGQPDDDIIDLVRNPDRDLMFF